MSIHPTAIIGSSACIGESVEIGPYAIIEDGASIGAGSRIGAHAVVKGSVRMGARCRIGEHAVLGGDPQDLSFDPATRSEVVIGEENVLREFVTLHRATREGCATVIGDRNFLMAGVHLGHDARLGSQCILANNVLLAGHVSFGDRIVVGGGTVFHQFVRVGDFAMIQGLSKFGQDILPFALAAEYNGVAGLNNVGMRRAGLDAATRESVRALYELFYHRGFSPRQFLEAAADGDWGEMPGRVVEFVERGSKRGYCRFIKASEFKGR